MCSIRKIEGTGVGTDSSIFLWKDTIRKVKFEFLNIFDLKVYKLKAFFHSLFIFLCENIPIPCIIIWGHGELTLLSPL